MIWILLVVLTAVVAVWQFYVKPLKYWSDRGVKQTNPWIFFGDLVSTSFRTISFAEWGDYVYKMYPDARYVGCYQFNKPTLVIRDPELLKQIMVKDFDSFMDHQPLFSDQSDPLWSKNLFALRGQKWKNMRNILSASFTSSKMKYMFSLMLDAVDDFTNHFVEKNEDFIEVEMKDVFTRLANDVIATTAFGIKVDSLTNPQNEFYLHGKEATDLTGIIINLKFLGYLLVPWFFEAFKIPFFNRKIRNFYNTIVGDTIKAREEQNIVRPDMINILLEARKGLSNKYMNRNATNMDDYSDELVEKLKSKRIVELTDQDITSQAMIFFLAGFDPLSTTMCFAFYELACNPDAQDKLRKEILEVLEHTNGKVTYENLVGMKYLDMVVSETLRKWSVSPLSDRVCTKPYVIEPVSPEERPVHLNPGDLIMTASYSVQRDPKYFPDPEKFDPERFSDENKNNIVPYTYFPFGVGPRACIGSRFAILEVKAILFRLISKFEFIPTAKTQIPLVLCKKNFNLFAEGRFWMGLKRLQTY
ncbi:cytochrome P450 9e2-like [Cylas formicarius]|uniref:cytochrome P450 9e2-like n=1 Tax=Cylas formicarius TaxID=197179 RepID=UPI002958C561|nr:cytochrome P450 9e2-like [Cylas formicarius]